MADRVTIELLLPGLGWKEGLSTFATESDRKADPLHSLRRLLSRADRMDLPLAGVWNDPREWVYFCHMQLAQACGALFPNAAFQLLGEGQNPGDSLVMSVRPVQLRAEQDRLVLLPLDGQLDDDYALALVSAFNEHFADRDLLLVAPSSDRWYLVNPPHSNLTTTPLYRVAWRNIQQSLPEGADGRWWRSLMNEVQMLFHSLSQTCRREALGLPVANAIWLEQAGRLFTPSSSWPCLIGDGPLIRGLASAARVEYRNLEDRIPLSRSSLIIDDRLVAPALAQDIPRWRDLAVKVLDDLQRLMLTQLKVGDWHVHPCNGQLLRLSARMDRRFWRRSRSLEKLLSTRSNDRPH